MSILQSIRGRIFLNILAIMVIGSINILSSSFAIASIEQGNSTFFLFKYALFAFIGFIAWAILAKIPYKIWLNRYTTYGILLFIFSLLVLVHFFGTTENGAKRWLLIGSFSLQPSELVKVSEILLMSSYIGDNLNKNRRVTLLTGEFFAILVCAAFVYKQPDLGTAAIIVALPLVMLLICKLPPRDYLLIFGGATLGILYLSTAAAYRADRIKAWLNPWAYQANEGFQAVQSFLAIGSGGLTGTGIGQGISKLFFLPEAHTDFAFAIFCQEWGFLGAVLLIALFALLSIQLTLLAKQTKDAGGFMLVVGANLLITGQAISNICMVTGLLPVIGVPLPFISYGGTSLLSIMCFLGIVFNVSKNGNPRKQPKPLLPTTPNSRIRAVRS